VARIPWQQDELGHQVERRKLHLYEERQVNRNVILKIGFFGLIICSIVLLGSKTQAENIPTSGIAITSVVAQEFIDYEFPESVVVVEEIVLPIVTATPIVSAHAVKSSPVIQENMNDPVYSARWYTLAEAVAVWFPEQQEKAMRVFMCESRGDPTAVSPNGMYYGVSQTDPTLHGPVPSDVFGQVAQARKIYLATYNVATGEIYGWRPWPKCGLR